MPVPGNGSSGIEQKTFGLKCAERDLAIEKKHFDSLRKSIEEGSPEGRVAYNVLIVSFTAFLDAHMTNEGCTGGTYCSVINETDRKFTNHDFLVMAEGFVKDGFPSFTEDDLAREDEALNAAYQAELSSLPASCPSPDRPIGCISQEGLRDTERAWIRYRDAWVIFGRVR